MPNDSVIRLGHTYPQGIQAVERRMDSYRLVFPAGAAGEEKIVKFCAADAGEALLIAHREAGERSAELWKNDEMVCSIRRTDVAGDDIWEIR